MRILYIDIDTLRADHLGCYGYHRNTSPTIDGIASQGLRLENCYVSDAPCLPSRASMFTGRFGIHTGIVGHGGSAADIRPVGRARRFSTMWQRPGFIWTLRELGMYPLSFSPYVERHSAWWFCEGWREFFNPGKSGLESADEIAPQAIDWLRRHGKEDNWLCHINLWDPHTPYRTPVSFGNPFEDEPVDPWYTEQLRRAQWESFGPGGPQEPAGAFGKAWSRSQGQAAGPGCFSRRAPDRVASLSDYKLWIDGYDCGIRYADSWVNKILGALADCEVLDETAIIITSDHGENFGELSVIGDHPVADHCTSRVPMIIRWPSVTAGGLETALHYQTDVAATLIELVGGEVPAHWDGRSFAEALRAGRSEGRDFLVLSQCAWSCQRAVRWEDYLFIRTYHTGLKNYPARMLFDVCVDPHETENLAEKMEEVADHGQALLEQWTGEMMSSSTVGEDPMWLVMREGGPFHTRRELRDKYLRHLRGTGRDKAADFLEAHPTGLPQGQASAELRPDQPV